MEVLLGLLDTKEHLLEVPCRILLNDQFYFSTQVYNLACPLRDYRSSLQVCGPQLEHP